MADIIGLMIFSAFFTWYIIRVIQERERNAEIMAKLQMLIKILDRKIEQMEKENKE